MILSLLTLFLIGTFGSELRAAEKIGGVVDSIISGEEKPKEYEKVEHPESAPNEYIEVEPKLVYPTDVRGVYYLVPYRFRRPSWGKTFGLGFSSYNPKNYEPDFVAATFDDVYGNASMPMIDFLFSVKKNFVIGSIGIEAGIGYYRSSSKSSVDVAGVPTAVDSTLNIYPIRIGGIFTMDNLFYEPFVAPYASAGVYSMFYRESRTTASFNGNTQISPYYAFGALAQLDWLDRAAAREAYEEAGVESTYVYLEARGFIQSKNAKDPDFSSMIHFNAGMRVEF